jgi:hypothetical protein
MSRAAAEAEKQGKLTRINLQIADVQNSIRRKQQELGEAALKLARDGQLSDPSVDPIVEVIGEQEKHVAELQEQLAQVQAGEAAPPQ